MATERGWWKLTTTIWMNDLTDADLEHIAKMIVEGYTEGEIIKDKE